MSRTFFDTNILIYSINRSEPRKQTIALERIADALRNGTGVLSTQVLSEFARVAIEKLRLPAATVIKQLHYFERLDVVPVTADALHRGIELQQLQKIAFWDSLILAAAERGGCDTLLSEDLSDGQLYGTVRVTNPFRT